MATEVETLHEATLSERIDLPFGYGSVELWSWWGWKIHFTKKGVQALSDAGTLSTVAGPIADKVVSVISGTLSTQGMSSFYTLCKTVFDIRAAITVYVAGLGDGEVDLYSPWCAVLAMIPVPSSGAPPDERLKFTVAKTNHNWSDGLPLMGAGANKNKGWIKGPAGKSSLGTYSRWGRLLCVYHTKDNEILQSTYVCATYDPNYATDAGWTYPGSIDYGRDPSLCEYQGYLYMVYRGSRDNYLRWRRYDRGSWGPVMYIGGNSPSVTSTDKVGLVEYSHRLILVARGPDGYLYWSTKDHAPNEWNTYEPIEGAPESASGPSVAVFDGKLYVVHRGNADAYLWVDVYDGSSWAGDKKMWPDPDKYSEDTPALAVFDDKLYCIYRGRGKDTIISYTMFDGETWSPQISTQKNSSAYGPAAISYKDPNETNQELLVTYHS